MLHQKKSPNWFIKIGVFLYTVRQYVQDSTDKNISITISANAYDMLTLDATVDGKRHRFSTGRRAYPWYFLWYHCHRYRTFEELYKKKYNRFPTSYRIFDEYGLEVLENTQKYRNAFTQKDQIAKHTQLCGVFGGMALHEIKASHILRWQNDTTLAPKTIINYRSTLNIIFKYAVYDEIMKVNPLSVVRAPKSINNDVEVFNHMEIEKLLQNTEGQLHNIILLVTFAGVRAGELIALRWSDVDFRSRTIIISKRIREGVEDVPKSKRIRVLDMLPQAKEALKSQALLTKKRSEYIFINRFDEPYKRSNKISASIRRICKKAKVKEGTLQTLRRSCNTLYKQYGLPNDWILDQLGHMKDDVNRKHYTGKIKPDLSRIGKVLAGS